MLDNFFAYAVKQKYIAVNPMTDVELKKRKGIAKNDKCGKALRPELHDDVLWWVMNDTILSPIVVTFIATGMRPQELIALQWENVDIENRKIGIVEAVKRTRTYDSDWNLVERGVKVGLTKTDTSVRTIDMSELVAEELTEWKQYCDDNGIISKFVFPNTKNGKMRSYSGIRTSFDRFKTRHGLQDENISLYTFRHTYAYVTLRKTKNLIAVAADMGHAKVSTTLDNYGSVFYEDRIETANAIDDAFIEIRNKKKNEKPA